MRVVSRLAAGLVGAILLLIHLAGTIYIGGRIHIAGLGFGRTLVGFSIVAVTKELTPIRWYKTLGGSVAGAVGALTLYSEVVSLGLSWAV